MTRTASLPEETSPSENYSHVSNTNSSAFQKRHRLANCLPYSAQLEQTRCRQWSQLKENFSSALLESGHSLLVWIKQMDAYLTVHRYAFSKAEHIQLVTGLWTAVQHLDDDLPTMAKVVPLLNRLLEKQHLLTREDFQVDWRPLFRLWQLADKKLPATRKSTLRPPIGISSKFFSLVSALEPYFAVSATAEMLAYFQPQLCVYDEMSSFNALYELHLFLPTYPVDDKVHEQWFTPLLRSWLQLPLDSKKDSAFLILFSRVAKRLNGYLNWEPFLPQIFDRLRHRMTTENEWKRIKATYFTFLVHLINEHSSAFEMLKTLFISENAGKLLNYSEALTEVLEKFIQRARKEKKALERGYWYFFTPLSHRLTPKLIDDFAVFIFDEVIIERLDLCDSEVLIKTLNKLALLCTETFAERLLHQKWVLAVERASEPDRMRSALKLIVAFLFPVLKNQNETIKVAYENKLNSILAETLSSLSTTDENIAYYQLLLLRSIIWLKIRKNFLNASTAFDFDFFTKSFIEVCFTFVESNCETMLDTNQAEDMLELIYEILQYSLMTIENEELCKSHVDRIIAFAFGQITDKRHVWKLLSQMLYAIMSADRIETVQLYAINRVLSTLKANIVLAIDGESAFANTCQNQMLHNFYLLQAFFNLADGHFLLRHQKEIIELLTSVYDLQFDCHFKWPNMFFNYPLSMLFTSLSVVYLVNQPYSLMENNTSTDELLHRILPENLPARWHLPTQEEISFVRQLLNTFIRPQIQFLQNFVFASQNNVEQPTFFAKLEKAIYSLGSLEGLVGSVVYNKPPLVTESGNRINKKFFKYYNFNSKCYLNHFLSLDEELESLFDKQFLKLDKTSNFGFSFFHELIKLLSGVATKLQNSEFNADTSDLLKNIIDICDFCLFPEKSYDGDRLATHFIRTELIFKTDLFKSIDDHRQLPSVQANRLNKYNQKVLKTFQTQSSELVFTMAHHEATHLLLDLAFNQFSEVRQKAQNSLNYLWKIFPGTFEEYAVPRLLTTLKQYENNYDAFKGALYILYGDGTSTDSPLLSGNWTEILLPIWPALVAVNWAEKPSIAQFADEKLLKHFYVLMTHPICLKENNFQTLKTMVSKLDQFSLPSEKRCLQINKTRKQISLNNEKSYLHRWRFKPPMETSMQIGIGHK